MQGKVKGGERESKNFERKNLRAKMREFRREKDKNNFESERE